MLSPTNTNYLSPAGFRLAIEKIPDVVFFAQELPLPGMDFGFWMQGTPQHDVPLPGDELTYRDFHMTFLVDEDMSNYKSLYNWLIGLGHPDSLNQYANFNKSEQERLFGHFKASNQVATMSDGILEILTNNSTPNNKIQFIDLFPVSIFGVEFQSNIDDINYVTCQATFKYTSFYFT